MTATAVRRNIFAGTLGGLLLCASLVVGQPPGGGTDKPKKAKPAEAAAERSLEDVLGAALKSNPDIRVAEAKVREAEAELNRTRLQTTQKVVTLHRALEAQKSLVQSAEDEYQQSLRLHATGMAPKSPEATRQKVLQAKAKLTEIEAELAYLAGQQPAGTGKGTTASTAVEDRAISAGQVALVTAIEEEAKAASKTPTTMVDKLRKALQTPVKVDFQKKTPGEILKEIQPKLEGVPIRIPANLQAMKLRPLEVPITVQLSEPIPLGGLFQLLEDENTDLFFVLREYGIVVVMRSVPQLHPPDAEGLVDFWKSLQRQPFFRQSRPRTP
jgi:hypothetical protein